MSWDDMTKNFKAWPSVSEVRDYRRQVYEAVRHVILTHPAFPSLEKEVGREERREGGRAGGREGGEERQTRMLQRRPDRHFPPHASTLLPPFPPFL
jgi:hypothetical protein